MPASDEDPPSDGAPPPADDAAPVPGTEDGGEAGGRRGLRARREGFVRQLRRLITAIREGDEQQVEESVLQLSSTRRLLAPLAFVVSAFVFLFTGLKVIITNWRLTLVQVLPAMWIWAAMVDLKVHVLRGKEFHVIRGPLVLLAFAAVVVLTAASFLLNAAFAFAVSEPGTPDIRKGFGQARVHMQAVLTWGVGVGCALAVAVILAPRWGLLWFAILLGVVLAVMMVCYVAVPARIVGVQSATTSRRDKVVASAVGGAIGAAVCAPPYLVGRLGLVLLGSSTFFPLGVILLAVGLMLYAGASSAVKAIKMSAKLSGSKHPSAPD